MGGIYKIKTVNIQGKEYSEVKDRVMFFRTNPTYAGFSIETEAIKLDEKVAIFKASIKNEKGVIVATGTAMEISSNGFINKQNHIENTETSAVGRALGFLGIGIVGGLATADNMRDAPLTEEWINEEQRAELAKMIQDSKADAAKFNESFSISALNELPVASFEKAKAMLQSKINKAK